MWGDGSGEMGPFVQDDVRLDLFVGLIDPLSDADPYFPCLKSC